MSILKSEKRALFEKLLFALAFAVAAFHTLLAAFRYIIPYTKFITPLRWAGFGVFILVALYLFISVCFSSSFLSRLKAIFRQLCTPEQVLLLLMLLWFVLSLLFNQINGCYPYLQAGDWLLFDFVVCTCFLFPLPSLLRRNTSKQWTELLIHLVVITYSVFTIVCLWHIFHLEVLDFPSGEQGGLTENFELVLGLHYNLTGMIAATMFCLCVIMIFTQELSIKILYAVFALSQLVVIYLCNSRTVFVGVLAFVSVTSFFFAWNQLQKQKLLLRLLLSLLVCGFITALYWFGRSEMFSLFDKITHFRAALSEGLRFSESQWFITKLGMHSASVNLPFLLAKSNAAGARGLTNLSHRLDVWAAALKVMFSSPQSFFFGVTLFDAPEAIRDIGGYQRELVAHAHNIILQIGISMGVPAMLMFLAFLVSVAVRSVRILIGKSGRFLKHSYVIPASVLCFVTINMAEAYLIGYFSVMGCFFFLLCGWIVAIDKK